MDVKNQLTCRFSIIEDHAKIIGPFLFCNLAADPHHFTDQLFVFCCYSRRPVDMFFGNNQEMNRSLGAISRKAMTSSSSKSLSAGISPLIILQKRQSSGMNYSIEK